MFFCPSKGVNSWLKHDIIQAENKILNNNSKETKQKELFTQRGHDTYPKNIMQLINPDNVLQVYEGYSKFPEETKGSVPKLKSPKSWDTDAIGPPKFQPSN